MSFNINDRNGMESFLQRIEGERKDLYLGREGEKVKIISRKAFNQMDDLQKAKLVNDLDTVIVNGKNSNHIKALHKIQAIRNELFHSLTPSGNIDRVPKDVLELILSHTSPKDVHFAKEVSKQFTNAATPAAQIQSINNGGLRLSGLFPGKRDQEVLDWLTKDKIACKNLTYADFRGFGDFTEEQLKTLAQCCPNIKSLFINSHMIGVDGAKTIATMRNITTLDLANCKIGDEGAQTVATMQNVITLHLEGNRIGDEGAQAIATMQNVITLNLAFNYIGVEGAQAVVKMPNITTVNLYYNNISYPVHEELQNIKHIKIFI